MEKINFSVDSSNALNIGEKHIDVHNNFDFKGLIYSADKNQICLSWVKSAGDWVPIDEVKGFMIVFDNVSLLKVQGCPSDESSARKSLSFMGYLHPEDIELMDGFLDEREASSDYHMIFVFENGFAVKVFSDQVEYKTN